MRRFAIVYLLALALFTGYLALDTFVIARVYAIVDDAPAAEQLGTPNATDPADSSAAADTTSPDAQTPAITLTEHRVHDTTVYAAEVLLSSAEQLRTALAQGAYGRNVTEETSSMAARAGALLAINGDFYGSRETGYVIRNGQLLRATPAGGEDLVIWQDGSMSIIDEDEVTAEDLLAQGAEQVFCFGPALVVDGAIAVEADEEVGKAMTDNPRTAIGIRADGSYLLVVSDGRTNQSEGLSLRELAEFMQAQDCIIAYNLDGGGSSTMVYAGEVINNPTTNGRQIKERQVSDIVCILP